VTTLLLGVEKSVTVALILANLLENGKVAPLFLLTLAKLTARFFAILYIVHGRDTSYIHRVRKKVPPYVVHLCQVLTDCESFFTAHSKFLIKSELNIPCTVCVCVPTYVFVEHSFIRCIFSPTSSYSSDRPTARLGRKWHADRVKCNILYRHLLPSGEAGFRFVMNGCMG